MQLQNWIINAEKKNIHIHSMSSPHRCVSQKGPTMR